MTMDCSSGNVTSEDEVPPPTSERALHEMPSGDSFLTEAEYDRELVECLINLGQALQDSETFLTVMNPTQTETLTPWSMMGPNPKFTSHVSRKKQPKNVEETITPYVPPASRGSSHWKECIEPATFKYVPNNGKYRSAKQTVQTQTPAMNWKRLRPLDKYMSPEQRMFQREVQRAFRRDQELKREAAMESERQILEGIKAVEQISVPRQEQPKPRKVLDTDVPTNSGHKKRNNTQNEPTITVTSPRDQESGDGGNVLDKQVLQPKLHDAAELPQMLVPSPGKRIADQFVETLSRRMEVLERELKGDMMNQQEQLMLRQQLLQQPMPTWIGKEEDGLKRSRSEPSRIALACSERNFEVSKETKQVSKQRRKLAGFSYGAESKHDSKDEKLHSQRLAEEENEAILSAAGNPDGECANNLEAQGGVVFHKVERRRRDRLTSTAMSAPSRSEFFERETRDISPASDIGAGTGHQGATERRRTFSFDNNMMQRAKAQRDQRLCQPAQNPPVPVISPSTSLPKVKISKVNPKNKTGAKVAALPGTKFAADNFTALPVRKSSQKAEVEEVDTQSFMPSVAGKRLQMSVGNHRVL